MIRAYVPWYLVCNYLVFAFIASLGALQVAAAHSQAARYRRARLGIAGVALAGTFAGFYGLAPELLTPGPAGGEMLFLFSGAALLAVLVTRFATPRRHSPRSERSLGSVPPDAQTAISGKASFFKPETRYLVLAAGSLAIALFDLPLFRALNGLASRTPVIDVPVQFLMNDYVVPTALALVLLALWFAGADGSERAHFQKTVLRALAALALASLTLKLINEVYFRPRPFTFDDSVRLLSYHPSDSALPSNAATVGSALAVVVWLSQKDWGTVMLMLSAGMACARIVGGVHYPADVMAGAWLGGSFACFVQRATWLERPLDAVIRLARRAGLG